MEKILNVFEIFKLDNKEVFHMMESHLQSEFNMNVLEIS